MLSPAEKAYYQALRHVQAHEYERATDQFAQAAEQFGRSQEFILLWETTRLLLAVKEEIRQNDSETIDHTEVLIYGKENELRR